MPVPASLSTPVPGAWIEPAPALRTLDTHTQDNTNSANGVSRRACDVALRWRHDGPSGLRRAARQAARSQGFERRRPRTASRGPRTRVGGGARRRHAQPVAAPAPRPRARSACRGRIRDRGGDGPGRSGAPGRGRPEVGPACRGACRRSPTAEEGRIAPTRPVVAAARVRAVSAVPAVRSPAGRATRGPSRPHAQVPEPGLDGYGSGLPPPHRPVLVRVHIRKWSEQAARR